MKCVLCFFSESMNPFTSQPRINISNRNRHLFGTTLAAFHFDFLISHFMVLLVSDTSGLSLHGTSSLSLHGTSSLSLHGTSPGL